MRKSTLIRLLATLILCSLLAASPGAFAEVSKRSSAPPQPQEKSQPQPLSLQEIINTAEPGTTVRFPSGLYTEVLSINKPLHIIGDDIQPTILNPTSSINGYAIQIIAEDVTVEGLSISNQAEGLYATGLKITARNTTIDNCLFHDTPIGIALWSSQNTIINSTFQGCDDEGIVLLGISSRPCSNNTITSCLFTQNCDGIELQYASYNQISFCEFISNTHAGIDGIESHNDNNVISECSFNGNSAFGLYLARSTQNLIIHCSFSSDSLTLVHAAQNTLQKSSVDTIRLLDDSSLLLYQCTGLAEGNIIAEQSTFEIRSTQQEQASHGGDTSIARYHQILIYILSHLRTIKTFLEQLSSARM
jgi:parallel beta-helix repeat protein